MTDQRGAAALMVIIVILAVSVLIASTTAFLGVDDLEIGYSHQAGTHAVLSAESCAEEAMLRLSRDSTYTGGTLNVGEADCSIVVSGTPCGACTISIQSVHDSFTRSVEVAVNITGTLVDIVSWQEID